MNEETRAKIEQIAASEAFAANPCFYLYDLGKLDQQIEKIRRAFASRVSVYYALKANPAREILCRVCDSGCLRGVEVASLGEFEKARPWFQPAQVIFTGPGKTNHEIQAAVEAGVRWIIVESVTEAHRLNSLATRRAQNILARINLRREIRGAHAPVSGRSSRIGIDEEAAIEALQAIKELPQTKLQGIHTFSASGILDSAALEDTFGDVFRLACRIEQESIPLAALDLGGGFGIDYSGQNRELNLAQVSQALSSLVHEYGFQSKELVFEIGRYLVGECGWYVSEIIDIKTSREKKHIVTAGGINHQHRPTFADMNHPVSIIERKKTRYYPRQPVVEHELATIGGPLCLRGDILGQDVFIEHAEIGDLLVIHHSGAYGLSMATLDFHSHPHPLEYFFN